MRDFTTEGHQNSIGIFISKMMEKNLIKPLYDGAKKNFTETKLRGHYEFDFKTTDDFDTQTAYIRMLGKFKSFPSLIMDEKINEIIVFDQERTIVLLFNFCYPIADKKIYQYLVAINSD